MRNNRQTPFWFLSIAIFLALIVPVLIQDGMFMDGVLYACVAHNLANGIGTFWFLEFSDLGFAGSVTFREHPPLVFGIQAIFFKILGNSIYVERFYSLLTACVTAYLIHILWKLITGDYPELKSLSWLPILLWILVPVGFWSFQNNMHENTMGIFTLLSAYFTLKALYSKNRVYIHLAISGVFIFLASFAKGPPGLFPIGVIGLYWIIERDRSFLRILLYTAILIAVPAIIYLLLVVYPDAHESLSDYVKERLLGRIESAPTTESRFFIIERLGMELLPPILIVGVLLALFKHKSIVQRFGRWYTKRIALLILIGLSGSIPLALTLVQKGFYLTPSLPFFAIGFALLVAPGLQTLINKISTGTTSFKIFRAITAALFISVIIISALQVGKTSRNSEQLHDIYLFGNTIPPNELISIDKSMWLQWDLQCYLIRHYNISVTYSDSQRKYYLREKSSAPPDNYEKIVLKTKRYNLYKQSRN